MQGLVKREHLPSCQLGCLIKILRGYPKLLGHLVILGWSAELCFEPRIGRRNRADPLVSPTRERALRPDSVEGGAANAFTGEGLEFDAESRIEAVNCLEQTDGTVAHEII